MVGVVANAAGMEVVAFRATAALNCVVIGTDTTAVRRGNVFAFASFSLSLTLLAFASSNHRSSNSGRIVNPPLCVSLTFLLSLAKALVAFALALVLQRCRKFPTG